MNIVYIGFRVEISKQIMTVSNLANLHNSASKCQLLDMHKEGKITIEKTNGTLMAHGVKSDVPTGLVNFAVVTKISSTSNAERIAKIVNVLGNDKLIREKVHTFAHNNSVLNGIPELAEIRNAFLVIDSIIPGFVRSGWYYAPEIIL